MKHDNGWKKALFANCASKSIDQCKRYWDSFQYREKSWERHEDGKMTLLLGAKSQDQSKRSVLVWRIFMLVECASASRISQISRNLSRSMRFADFYNWHGSSLNKRSSRKIPRAVVISRYRKSASHAQDSSHLRHQAFAAFGLISGQVFLSVSD